MMQSIHKSGANAQDIVFLSKVFKGATLKSKGHFLRRMQIVTKTLHMYNTKVKDIRFVGVVGAEDAGKSTFIRVG
jgi:ABC-type polysaccharide/polyol phosphate transport system ATPase subunit